MKGCALRAVLQLAVMVMIVAAVGGGLIFIYRLPLADVLGASLLAGLLIWVGVSLLMGAVSSSRERRALGNSIDGRPPRDGERTILVGHLEAVGKPLRSPLSERRSVAFTFEVWEMHGGGKSRRRVVYLDGLALTPTRIVTNAGSFKLLAVPELDCDPTPLDHATAVVRATALFQRAPYEPVKPFSGRPSIEQQWNDTDGEFQRVTRHAEQDVDLANCTCTEKILEPGDRVCVFGTYSEAQRAIVPDSQDWSKMTRVMKGEAGDILRQLNTRVVRRLLVALVVFGLAAGTLLAFTSSLE